MGTKFNVLKFWFRRIKYQFKDLSHYRYVLHNSIVVFMEHWSVKWKTYCKDYRPAQPPTWFVFLYNGHTHLNCCISFRASPIPRSRSNISAIRVLTWRSLASRSPKTKQKEISVQQPTKEWRKMQKYYKNNHKNKKFGNCLENLFVVYLMLMQYTYTSQK